MKEGMGEAKGEGKERMSVSLVEYTLFKSSASSIFAHRGRFDTKNIQTYAEYIMRLPPILSLFLSAAVVRSQAVPGDPNAPSGSSTDGIPRPKIGSVPYGSVITACSQPGTMALTFDDGPAGYTTQILDLLDELQVKATFFIVGRSQGNRIEDAASGWPAVLQRMYNAGHQLGSHTFTHLSLNNPTRWTEVTYNEMVFRNIFGWFPTYLRPPYLECGQECVDFLGERGYHVISANVDTKDFEHDDPVGIEESRRLFSAGVSPNPAGNGYIVLAHDIHYNTVANLARYMIQEARRLGYRLVTVGECLGDPPANWYRPAAADIRSYRRH
ncbi:hypothetical protein CP532_3306 [Ophiocordyceps camponoti-leonardi (nom. inval.)]|nr:hypothetical protein CP532_3306 [Ophiocordyceps camponoti-leonardi (nom. inval.)]